MEVGGGREDGVEVGVLRRREGGFGRWGCGFFTSGPVGKGVVGHPVLAPPAHWEALRRGRGGGAVGGRGGADRGDL